MSNTDNTPGTQTEEKKPAIPYRVRIKRITRTAIKAAGAWLAATARTIQVFIKKYPRLAYNFVFFLLLGCSLFYYYKEVDKGSANQKSSAINLLNSLPDEQKLDTLARFMNGDAIRVSAFPHVQTYTVTPKTSFTDRIKEPGNEVDIKEYASTKYLSYINLTSNNFLYKGINGQWIKMHYTADGKQAALNNKIDIDEPVVDYDYNSNALAIPYSKDTLAVNYIYLTQNLKSNFSIPVKFGNYNYERAVHVNVPHNKIFFSTKYGVNGPYKIYEATLQQNELDNYSISKINKLGNDTAHAITTIHSAVATPGGLAYVSDIIGHTGKETTVGFDKMGEKSDNFKMQDLQGHYLKMMYVADKLRLYDIDVKSKKLRLYTYFNSIDTVIDLTLFGKELRVNWDEVNIKQNGNTVWALFNRDTEAPFIIEMYYNDDGIYQAAKSFCINKLEGRCAFFAGKNNIYILGVNNNDGRRNIYHPDTSGNFKTDNADSTLLGKTAEATLYLNALGDKPEIIADFYNQTYLVQFIKDAGGYTPRFIGGVNLADNDFDVHVEVDLFLVFILFVFVTALYYLLYFFVSGYLISRRAEINYDAPVFTYLPFLKAKLQALENKAKELRARSEGMLSLGILLGVGGAVAGVITFKYSQLTNADTWTPKALFSLLRPFVLLTFIQVFTFFFLKQYRIIFNEYKRFYSSFLKAANYVNAIEMNSDVLVSNNVVDAEMKKVIANKILDEITQLHENDTMAKIDEFDHESITKVGDIIDKFKTPGGR